MTHLFSDKRVPPVQLLYVAPEKLLNPGVLDSLRRMPHGISLACIDEAHCVSECVCMHGSHDGARQGPRAGRREGKSERQHGT